MKVRPEDDWSLELQDQSGNIMIPQEIPQEMSSKRTRRRKREAGSVRAAVQELAGYYPIAMCRGMDTEVSYGTVQKHVWRAWDEEQSSGPCGTQLHSRGP